MSWINWIILGVILTTIEIFTPTFFALLFGIGAFLAGLASYFGATIALQWIIFLGVSALLVLYIRKFFIKHIQGLPTRDANVDEYIGKEAIVLSDIDKNSLSGRIKIEGEIWVAVTDDPEPIKTGELVKIIGVSGTKLIVKKEEK